MFQRILVVLENERICRQALEHARQLALRMDAEVTVLMVVEMAFGNSDGLRSKRSAIAALEESGGELLAGLTAEFLREGVSTSAALRVGDPSQELLKFLAERPPFQMVIWGSGEDLGGSGRRTHWLAKAVSSLECPLWTVSSSRAGRGEDPPCD